MRLTTLGTGTISLSAERACAGHLVEAGAVRVLLDCGGGVAHRLAQFELPWREITHVAFTHFHTDHIADFATLSAAWKFGARFERRDPLTVIGPVGIREVLERLLGAFDERLDALRFPATLLEIQPGQQVDLGDCVSLVATKVPHSDESVAYSLSRGGRRIVYTGDTGYDPMFGEWARGADVLLCECSLPTEVTIPEHMTPEQCGALAAAALPKHLVLTHFFPPVELIDVRSLVAAHYAGPITLASDGATFEIEEG